MPASNPIMKALDDVMLWVARGFTAAALLLFGLPWVLMLFNIVLALLITLVFPTSHSAAWYGVDLSLPHLFDRPGTLVGLAYSLFWFATVRSLPSKAARICLGASSAFCIFVAVVGLIPHLIHPRLSTLAFILPFSLIVLIGSTAMLWVSIRPLQNSNTFPHDSITHSSLLQSC